MNITKITIGRLYNLGNYEHIRYELTVEVKDGEAASVAIRGAENIINSLNPKRPGDVPSASDITSAKARIAILKTMTDEEYKDQYGYHGDNVTQADRLATMEKQLAEGLAKRETWDAQQAHARQLCDDVPVAATYTDAKDKWDDQY